MLITKKKKLIGYGLQDPIALFFSSVRKCAPRAKLARLWIHLQELADRAAVKITGGSACITPVIYWSADLTLCVDFAKLPPFLFPFL